MADYLPLSDNGSRVIVSIDQQGVRQVWCSEVAMGGKRRTFRWLMLPKGKPLILPNEVALAWRRFIGQSNE